LKLRRVVVVDRLVKIVRLPEVVQRAWVFGFESDPRLSLAAPMEEADRTRVQRPAAASDIVAAEAVLVPPVVYGLHVAGEDE